MRKKGREEAREFKDIIYIFGKCLEISCKVSDNTEMIEIKIKLLNSSSEVIHPQVSFFVTVSEPGNTEIEGKLFFS